MPWCILSNSLSACDQGRDFCEYLNLMNYISKIKHFPHVYLLFCFFWKGYWEVSVDLSRLILYGWSSHKRTGFPPGTHGPVLPQPQVPVTRLLASSYACNHPAWPPALFTSRSIGVPPHKNTDARFSPIILLSQSLVVPERSWCMNT